MPNAAPPPSQPLSPETPVPPVAAKAPRARCLVIDDDETMLDQVANVLRNSNIDVEKSFDGLDGLRRCQSASYDLVVCDVRMPRLSGLSFLTNLAMTGNAKTPVVMMSALDDPTIRRQALAGGARAYLVKPFTADALREILTWLGLR